MRPQAFYAVYDMGRVIAITKGAAQARKISPHRAYKAFKTQLAAEEWAACHNYQRDQADAADRAALSARIATKGITPFSSRT